MFESLEYRERGGHPVVVVSHGYWQRQLGGQSPIVGQPLRIGGKSFQIVGVLPEGFGGMTRGLQPEMFLPISMIDDIEPAGEISSEGQQRRRHILDWRGWRFLNVYGRLADGVTFEQAAAETAQLTAAFAQAYPESNADHGAQLIPTSNVHFDPDLDAILLPVAGVVLGMVGIVLLVACANLANLLLARANGRRREIALRLALGANRPKLLRQLMVESLLLSLVGGVAGLGFAALGMRGFELLRPDLPIQPTIDLRLDPDVLLFTVALSLLTGLLFGLVPALQASKLNLVTALKSDATTPRKRRGAVGRLLQPGSLLVVTQVALSLVLVVGASLLLRSLAAARTLDLGFDAERIGVVTADLSTLGVGREEATERWRRVQDRVESLPGIEASSVATRLPLGINVHTADFFIAGHRESPSDPPIGLDITTAGADYFETMGVELVDGRLLDARDHADAPGVAVVTRAMQRRFWPNESAVGKRFRISAPDTPAFEIVGVVDDYKVRTPGESPRPMVHFAQSQRPRTYGNLIFRSGGSARASLESVVREIQATEPALFLMDTTTLDRMRDVMLLPVSAGGALVGGMSLLALLLAGVGLSGLIAYWVSQRTREIGIRMAIGASRWHVVGLVLLRSLSLVGAGAVVGLGGALLLGRVLGQVLYVPTTDPFSLVTGVAALSLTALAASLLPARRATAVDPLVALRDS